MKQFREIAEQILQYGTPKGDRTKTGTLSYFGIQKEFDLTRGFPIVTGKFTPFRTMSNELLWMLSGSTNNEDLRWINGRIEPTIWEEWANVETGELGPIYGKQWRSWSNLDNVEGHGIADYPIDQIATLIKTLKEDPDSRRLLVSAWNVADISKMNLPPCHYAFEFWTCEIPLQERINNYLHAAEQEPPAWENLTAKEVETYLDNVYEPRRYISCKVNQRSCDLFLGVPYNIASYALLTHLIGHVVNMRPKKLVWSGGDVHIYHNHSKQLMQYLQQQVFKLPTLRISPDCPRDIDKILPVHFWLDNYLHGPVIDAPIAV